MSIEHGASAPIVTLPVAAPAAASPLIERLVSAHGAHWLTADIGVATREDEDAIARRYGSIRWPALVFVRDGQYVTTLSGMLDWDVYVERVGLALTMPTSRAPTVGIPVRNAGAGSESSCH